MRSGPLLSAGISPAHQEHIACVYRYAVRKGGIDAVETVADELGLEIHEAVAAIDELIESHLLREEFDSGRLLVPVDPKIAAAALVSPMEREIYQRHERIAQIRERIEMFHPDYASVPSAQPEPVEHIVGAMEVRGYLRVATDSARQEILVLQPGPREGGEFDDSLHACANLLARGVSVRIVYPHRNRAELATRMRLSSLASAGAKVRTVSHVPRPAVVFDATTAFLLGSTRGVLSASRVRDDGILAFLLGMFNDLWDGATPVDGADTGYAEVTDDLWQTIATLMANGFTDEVMARKLGMSVRTCRRHIAALMRELDAVSRFQAGTRAAHRGLVVE